MKNRFLLEDRLNEIENKFTRNGWVTIYENNHDKEVNDLIFCCLIKKRYLSKYLKDRNWGITLGSEGKPAIISNFKNGKSVDTYQTYSDSDREPFLFSKQFTHNDTRYVDISEEFVLYWRLYEEGIDKQHRKFLFIDELGETEEVIVIEPTIIKIKLKFLKEYLSLRKMHFAICFDFERWEKGKMEDFDTAPKDEDIITKSSNFNHYIRYFPAVHIDKNMESWIHGKTVILFDSKNAKSYHSLWESQPNEKFITGYDQDGNDILLPSGQSDKHILVVTYFKREVLDKYYNDPMKYEVDGFYVKSKFFYLKIDNNHPDYVAVFLKELGTLPTKEQLHWKHHNIVPQKGISATYYETMIEGNWASTPGNPDIYFKSKYLEFNEKWNEKFGWPFYKPLDQNNHYFTSLHIPSSNNIKTFCEQMLAIVKLTIDCLNEAEMSKKISLDDNDKGIAKLEKLLALKGRPLPDMIEFLKQLQNLRSGFIAHRFSKSNKKTEKALAYFKISEKSYSEVAKDIFIKSIFTLNTLESRFLK